MLEFAPGDSRVVAADLGDYAGVCTKEFSRSCGRPWRRCWSLHQRIPAGLRPTLAKMLELAPGGFRRVSAYLDRRRQVHEGRRVGGGTAGRPLVDEGKKRS
ncbi:hypothetical protein MLD38_005227 [Melastoma candidum]|uniref:Uncharacterized protein n=1 Tax=Melastoma candidum TaxID=119954 RepID=A0ACB9S8B0_9MYRT|nr:hypothetical protein MLD38_005227 [Melastoma candidum]